MMIYLSGPMSGIEDHNYPAFIQATNSIRLAGYHVLSPHELGQVEGWSWEDYMRRDIVMMLQACDTIVLLPGWEDSEGAQLELDIADRMNFTVGSYVGGHKPIQWLVQGKTKQ